MYWYVTLKPKTSSLRWSIDFLSPINAQAKFFVMVRAPWSSTAFSNHFVGGYIYIESLKFALGVYTRYACIGNVSFCVRWSRPGVVSLFVKISARNYNLKAWMSHPPPTFIRKFALYISRPFLHAHHCVNSVIINFTLNLTQGVFIDRIYRINNHTETWNFNASTLVTSASPKITTKMGNSTTKRHFF